MLQARLTKTTSTLALAAATVALLAACGGGVQAGPTPSPTWSCTPDASGEPCTPERAAAQQEEAEAYAEAEHVYREFTKERNRVSMEGGAPAPSPEMRQWATGDFLDTVAEFHATAYDAGRRTSAPLEVLKVEPVSYSPNAVRLLACEDGRDVQVIGPDGAEVDRGQLGALEITVERFEGYWKLAGGADAEVSRCE